MVTEKKIVYLFDEVWQTMEYCHDRRADCLRQYSLIHKQFVKHKLNFNSFLHALLQYDGIGITIATGLIWVAYPGRAVPFDKYTTTWCLQKGYIKTPKVSSNYKKICADVIAKLKAQRKTMTVEEFVREAWIEAEDMEWSVSAE